MKDIILSLLLIIIRVVIFWKLLKCENLMMQLNNLIFISLMQDLVDLFLYNVYGKADNLCCLLSQKLFTRIKLFLLILIIFLFYLIPLHILLIFY